MARTKVNGVEKGRPALGKRKVPGDETGERVEEQPKTRKVIKINHVYQEKHLGEVEDLQDQIKGLKKDIVTLENGKTKLENEAKVEAVRMKAVEDQLAKAEAQCVFYQGRLFPVQTPTNGAAHGASVSMAGGGGNRVASPAAFFASPPE